MPYTRHPPLFPSASIAATYAETVLADSPVGYYRLGESSFGEACVDVTGNQNGVYTNTTGLTFSQTGISGAGGNTAVRFISANIGYVAIADAAAQHVANTFTIEAWVKLASLGSPFGVFTGGASKPVMVIDAGGHVNVARQGVATIVIGTGTIADTTTFHHCVWTKSGATSILYLDGVAGNGAVTDFTFTNAAALLIGGNGLTPAQPMNGTIDEVALYPTALSPARVSAHFAAGGS